MQFTVRVSDLIGERVRVIPWSRRPIDCYDLMASAGLVGELILGGQTEIARVACADGEWRVTKRRRLGWELLIHDGEGHHVGWYSGRHWRRGGTIALTDGTQVDLRCSMTGRWSLQTDGGSDSLAEFHRAHPPAPIMAFTVHALPAELRQPAPLVFMACAVLMLDYTLAVNLPGVSG